MPEQFAKVPIALATDPRISSSAIRLYAVLAGKYANRNGQCYPSRESLRLDLGVERLATVSTLTEELMMSGWIEVKEKGGKHGNNLYTVRKTVQYDLPHSTKNRTQDSTENRTVRKTVQEPDPFPSPPIPREPDPLNQKVLPPPALERSEFFAELATRFENGGFGFLHGMPSEEAHKFEADFAVRWQRPPPKEVAAYAVGEAEAHGVRKWAYVRKVLAGCLDSGGVPKKEHRSGIRPESGRGVHPQGGGDHAGAPGYRAGLNGHAGAHRQPHQQPPQLQGIPTALELIERDEAEARAGH